VRVLHVIEELASHGGTPRKLLYLVRNLHAAGRKHSFVVFVRGDLEAVLEEAGCKVYRAASPDIRDITQAVWHAIDAEQPQVISAHFSRALFCSYLANLWKGLPLVYHAHGPAAAPGTMTPGRAKAMVVRQCLKKARLITANSRFTAATLQKAYGLPDAKVRVIYNPVEARRDESVAPAQLPARAPDVLRIVHIGGFIPVRDQGTLIRGLAELRRSGVNAELVLVGDGVLKPELQALGRELDVESNVYYLGYRQDVAAILTTATVYANACVSEGFGIAVVEAMLHGVPVVVADCGAHPEFVEHGSTGLLFRARDGAEFAHHTLSLWRNAALRERIAGSARTAAIERFAPHRYVESFNAVMREACS
jgi:glycosyltransferase involved in cell wall biosynthesis